jgi:hypothetical protein
MVGGQRGTAHCAWGTLPHVGVGIPEERATQAGDNLVTEQGVIRCRMGT